MLTLTTLVSVWGGLFLAVLALGAARKWISRREDDTVHLADGEVELVQHQASVATILSQVDVWGKVLTVIVVLYGLAIAARVLYMGWMDSLQIK
jgi:hypothetical protein